MLFLLIKVIHMAGVYIGYFLPLGKKALAYYKPELRKNITSIIINLMLWVALIF